MKTGVMHGYQATRARTPGLSENRRGSGTQAQRSMESIFFPYGKRNKEKLTTRPFSHSPEGLPDRGGPCRRHEKRTSQRLYNIRRSTAKGLLPSVKSAAYRRISIFLESKVLFPLGADWAPYRERPPPKMACRFHSPARREHPLFPGEKSKREGNSGSFDNLKKLVGRTPVMLCIRPQPTIRRPSDF